MKKTLLTTLASLGFILLFGQKTEFKVQLNSGLFSFVGASAVHSTFINGADSPNSGYTNNPYGAKYGLCYGASATVTRVTRRKFLLGLDVGYEILKSKVSIESVNGRDSRSSFDLPATGQTFLNFSFLNIYPHIGQRFIIKNVVFDITGGLDIGRCFKAVEQGEATTTDGQTFTTSRNRTTLSNDIRPRIQLATTYGTIGIYVGYAEGIPNYLSGYVGGTNESRSRLIRFGLSYRIK